MKWKYVFIGISLLLGACQPMGNKQADAQTLIYTFFPL